MNKLFTLFLSVLVVLHSCFCMEQPSKKTVSVFDVERMQKEPIDAYIIRLVDLATALRMQDDFMVSVGQWASAQINKIKYKPFFSGNVDSRQMSNGLFAYSPVAVSPEAFELIMTHKHICGLFLWCKDKLEATTNANYEEILQQKNNRALIRQWEQSADSSIAKIGEGGRKILNHAIAEKRAKNHRDNMLQYGMFFKLVKNTHPSLEQAYHMFGQIVDYIKQLSKTIDNTGDSWSEKDIPELQYFYTLSNQYINSNRTALRTLYKTLFDRLSKPDLDRHDRRYLRENRINLHNLKSDLDKFPDFSDTQHDDAFIFLPEKDAIDLFVGSQETEQEKNIPMPKEKKKKNKKKKKKKTVSLQPQTTQESQEISQHQFHEQLIVEQQRQQGENKDIDVIETLHDQVDQLQLNQEHEKRKKDTPEPEVLDVSDQVIEETSAHILIQDTCGRKIKILKTDENLHVPTMLHGKKIVYAENVQQWFDHPYQALQDQGYFNISNALKYAATRERQNECIFMHAFSQKVDAFLALYGKQSLVTKRRNAIQEDYLIALPVIVQEKNQIRYGLCVYIFDQKSLICYHRNFVEKSAMEIMKEYYQKGFYDVLFPQLS